MLSLYLLFINMDTVYSEHVILPTDNATSLVVISTASKSSLHSLLTASSVFVFRYNVMPKLVNFMAPFTPHQDWDEDRKYVYPCLCLCSHLCLSSCLSTVT